LAALRSAKLLKAPPKMNFLSYLFRQKQEAKKRSNEEAKQRSKSKASGKM